MQDIKSDQLITVDHQPSIYRVLKVKRDGDGNITRLLIDTAQGPHPIEPDRVQILPMTGDRAGVLAKPFIAWRLEQRDKHDADSEEYKRMTAEVECISTTIYVPVHKDRKGKDGVVHQVVTGRSPESFNGAWWLNQVFEVTGIHKEFARLQPNAYIPLYCLYKVPQDVARTNTITAAA